MTSDEVLQAIHDDRIRILNEVTKLFKAYVASPTVTNPCEQVRVTILGTDVQAACVGKVRT